MTNLDLRIVCNASGNQKEQARVDVKKFYLFIYLVSIFCLAAFFYSSRIPILKNYVDIYFFKGYIVNS